MYKINDELKEKVSNLNILLGEKYKDILAVKKVDLRSFINKNVGDIKKIEKLTRDNLSLYEKKGGIVGVDGSNNKVGGAYPHFVEVYQALAKSTLYKNEPLTRTDIYTPLYSTQEENPLENTERIIEENRNIKLSTLEVEVALDSIERYKPYVILMDGGLIRYNIYAQEKWTELRSKCEEKGIILIGVIKDIKTSIIGDMIKKLDSNIREVFYDRELLFGQLDYGEVIIIKDEANKKEPKGYASAFIRSSLAPSVIGMDILDSQREYIEEMARLVFTLTPENSRGVPLWLDIVDKEVKISDNVLRALMERYMDRGIYERFFVSERDKRS